MLFFIPLTKSYERNDPLRFLIAQDRSSYLQHL